MSDAARRRALPAAMRVEMVAMADGWPVRRVALPPGPRGSLFVVNGRGDFVEKFAESFHDWGDAGWGVVAFDHRGQGGSGRFLADRQKGHAPGFAPWLGDLAEHVDWFRSHYPAPHYAVAHSMGGHLMLRHLEVRGGDFDRVVLVSPMCGVAARPIGPWLARLIARLCGALGLTENFAPGSGPTVPDAPGSARQQLLTHDAARYSDEGWWVKQNPALGIGGVTNGWLTSAFASIDAVFAPGVLERTLTPLLILAAGDEGIVDNAATARAAARLPNATLEVVAGGFHELLREVDGVRAGVLAKIDGFLR